MLPVMSVNSEEEARELLIATCSRGSDGHYYSDELAQEQSLERLEQFSQKLERTYAIIQSKKGTT